jgi:8-oxo-dGTP pyrophosphatase MutT (NUDIX family)
MRFGVTKSRMRREFSAGAVLVRRMHGRWWLAAVRPQGKREGTWALPKGLVDVGEKAAETALREAFEETGVRGRLDAKLGDVRYVYTESWTGGSGERVFKVVSFFLAHARRGRIGELPAGMEVEVAEARWLPLDEAPRLLAYRGERDMAAKAVEKLANDPL